jgi:hypothetical protein
MVSPASVMVGAGLAGITVIGTNFTPTSQVIFNGVTVATSYQSSTVLSTQLYPNPFGTVGTYTVSVQDQSGKSNQVNFKVYSPIQGPQLFSALPGYPMGGSESQIAVGDIDGDGLADAITRGPESINSASISILRGQRDGTFAQSKLVSGAGTAFAVGDVNGDGSNDIVAGLYPASASSSSTSSFTVLQNDGKGNFTQGATATFNGTYPGPISPESQPSDPPISL